MDFKRMEMSELASLVKISLKEPGIGKIQLNNQLLNKISVRERKTVD